MNALPPFYAFATSPCQPFTNHGTTIFEFIQNGIKFQGATCDEARKKAGVQTKQISPTRTTPRHSGIPTPKNTTVPPSLNATGTASIGATGAASVGAGAGAIATGSTSGADFSIPGVDDILGQISAFLDSFGIPRDFMGIPTVYIIGGGAAALILLLVLKR